MIRMFFPCVNVFQCWYQYIHRVCTYKIYPYLLNLTNWLLISTHTLRVSHAYMHIHIYTHKDSHVGKHTLSISSSLPNHIGLYVIPLSTKRAVDLLDVSNNILTDDLLYTNKLKHK